MSDELNVWRDARDLSSYRPLPSASTPDTIAAAVIRTYGDERHTSGYQAAIADVVEWLGVEAELIRNLKDDTDIAASIQNLEVLARARDLIANEITRRFGKGQ
jgi:hypothetical protein